ncbi:RluA family pseudouridine synthase [Candidatus Falkowbacteria bacterium]|nr:MAG: RluA family pseudouridine synthase [Candidatus Falkowbacteria bacterium]
MRIYKNIFKNNEFIVINKPAGLLTHGAPHIDEKTLAEALLEDYPKLINIGEDRGRPGIMHRLDKLASGLLVIARTQDSFDNLKAQFKKRTIKKYYKALVYGKIEKDADEISFPIKRSAQGYKMAALPETVNGKKNITGRQAITEFEIIKKFINYTFLDVKIITGRTHQIRVHMCAYGHPVVGDDLYSTKKTRIKNKKLNLGRLFLHAYSLEFIDLKGKRQKFEVELPEELTNFLKIVK